MIVVSCALALAACESGPPSTSDLSADSPFTTSPPSDPYPVPEVGDLKEGGGGNVSDMNEPAGAVRPANPLPESPPAASGSAATGGAGESLPAPPTDPAALRRWKRLQENLDYLYEVDLFDPGEHSSGCLEDEYDNSSVSIGLLTTSIADAEAIAHPTADDVARLDWLKRELEYVRYRRGRIYAELEDREVGCALRTSYVELAYSYAQQDHFHADSYGIHAAVALPLAAPWRAQVDGGFVERRFSSTSTGTWTIDGQGGYQVRSDYFGGLVGAVGYKDSTLVAGFADYSHFFSNVTLNAAVGYGRESPFSSDIWGGRATVRYFPYSNFAAAATAGAYATTSHVTPSSSFTDTYYDLGVGAEYKIPNLPLSVIFDYDHIWGNPGGIQADAIRAGLRLTVGGTLKERDRSGAGEPTLRDELGPNFGS